MWVHCNKHLTYEGFAPLSFGVTMARKKKEVEEVKEEPKAPEKELYKCCFCDHISINVGGVTIGGSFELTDHLKRDADFMSRFNKALANGVICQA